MGYLLYASVQFCKLCILIVMFYYCFDMYSYYVMYSAFMFVYSYYYVCSVLRILFQCAVCV